MHPRHFFPKIMKHALDTPDVIPIHLTHHPDDIQNPIRFFSLLVLILISGRHVVFQVPAQVSLDDIVDSSESPVCVGVTGE